MKKCEYEKNIKIGKDRKIRCSYTGTIRNKCKYEQCPRYCPTLIYRIFGKMRMSDLTEFLITFIMALVIGAGITVGITELLRWLSSLM